jgi:N-acetylglutamate synthase-like GNAT family acetyltransferase
VTVRDATPDDSSRLAELLAELGYPDEVERIRARVRALAQDPASFVLVVETDGMVTGLACASVMPLLQEDGSWCRLSALVVAGDRRREGIGRVLVGAVEERARAMDCRYLEVTSGDRPGREAAHAFYGSLGLAEVSRRYLGKL